MDSLTGSLFGDWMLKKLVATGFITVVFYISQKLFGGTKWPTISKISEDPIATAILLGAYILAVSTP